MLTCSQHGSIKVEPGYTIGGRVLFIPTKVAYMKPKMFDLYETQIFWIMGPIEHEHIMTFWLTFSLALS